ncbi:hypothetical protein AB0442_30910 [Kitasatospora sp. NPDC085895]|uniref:hypothetical protein n=1 Tax=Kitasatospora sp. NPDC085895 TaxID=3155057 RepID=UPI00344F1875
MVHADPQHDDWSASLLQWGRRADQETFAWARKVAEDVSSSPVRRHFGLPAVGFLGFGLGVASDDEPP